MRTDSPSPKSLRGTLAVRGLHTLSRSPTSQVSFLGVTVSLPVPTCVLPNPDRTSTSRESVPGVDPNTNPSTQTVICHVPFSTPTLVHFTRCSFGNSVRSLLDPRVCGGLRSPPRLIRSDPCRLPVTLHRLLTLQTIDDTGSVPHFTQAHAPLHRSVYLAVPHECTSVLRLAWTSLTLRWCD